MSCTQQDEVVAFATGELGAEHAARLEAHVDRCAACRELLSALARALPAPTAEARVGRYRLGGRIGRGGMGEVYRAEPSDRPGSAIALKLLPRIESAALLHFKQEFRSVADVTHRNLVSLYELGCDGDDWFIAMELVDGTDFLSYVAGDHERLRAVVRQLAEGLSALHAAGHVHRDIKPANVMVEPDGRVVILDFGLVAALSHRGDAAAGTPAYMAPEQLAGDPPSVAGDFYSVGVMLHEALTGQRPGSSAVTPSGPPDLAQLCKGLLAPDVGARAGASEIAAALGGPSARAEPSPCFVGRSGELARLTEVFAEVRCGHARVITVEGPSGIGKTALVGRFLQDVADAFVVHGRCHDRETIPHKALDPLMDELGRRIDGLAARERALLCPDDVADLARMFPVLGAAFDVGTVAPAVDPHSARRRAARALRSVLTAIAARRPLILWIDDLQWGDSESAPLLAEIFETPAPALLLIASHRPGPIPVLGTLDRCTLVLEPLPEDDARTLAAQLAHRDVADWIARESEGNPLFIAELSRHRAPVTTSLDHAIQERFAALPESARTLLAAVAVAGRPIDEALLARATQADDAALSRLRAERWVAARDNAIETVHERVRAAICGTLAPAETAAWHRRFASALEAAGNSDPEALLEHWRGAGDGVRAQSYAVAAGEQAMTALAFERAARLYALAASLAPAPRERIADLCALRAEALAAAGRGAEAAAAYDEARAHVTGDAATEYHRLAAEQLLRSGHIDAGLSAMDGVLDAMGVRPLAGPRTALVSLAIRRLEARLRLAMPLRRRSETSLEARRAIDTSWAVASALGTVDTMRAAELHARTLVEALRAGDPMRLSRSLAAEAAFAAAAGPRARARAERLLALAHEVCSPDTDPLLAGTHAGATGMVAFLTGRWSDALAACDVADRGLGQCAGGAWERDTARLYALISLSYLGQLRELRRRIAFVLADAEERGDLYVSTSARTALCNVAWLASGDLDTARRHAMEGERMWSRRGFHLQHYWSLMSCAQADLYSGDGERAFARVTERWSALKRSLLLRIEVVLCEALYLRARAALASAHGAARDERLRRAERDMRRLARRNAPHARALASLVRAGLAACARDTRRACRNLDDAETVLDTLGMALHARAAQRTRGLLSADSALVRASDTWMRAEEIADPTAIAAMLIPLPDSAR